MPEARILNYYFTGPTRVLLWNQKEMAMALGLSEADMIKYLGNGSGLSYHAHPLAVGEYLFNTAAYESNIRVWACLSDDGHQMEEDPKYDYLPEITKTCVRCGYTKHG